MKNLHLTEGRNTGFKKILKAIRTNGSPLPEFETDEAHDYFVTRLFIHERFYEEQNVVENVVENLAPRSLEFLGRYSRKKWESEAGKFQVWICNSSCDGQPLEFELVKS